MFSGNAVRLIGYYTADILLLITSETFLNINFFGLMADGQDEDRMCNETTGRMMTMKRLPVVGSAEKLTRAGPRIKK